MRPCCSLPMLLLLVGCAAPVATHGIVGPEHAALDSANHKNQPASTSGHDAAATTRRTAHRAETHRLNREVVAVLDELEQRGHLGTTETIQLAEDLSEVPPAMRKILVRNLKASFRDREPPKTTGHTAANARSDGESRSERQAEGSAKQPPLPLESPLDDSFARELQPWPAATKSARGSAFADDSDTRAASFLVSDGNHAAQGDVDHNPADATEYTVGDWRAMLLDVINALKQTSDRSAKTKEQAELEQKLRLLYLAAGKSQDAVKPIKALDDADQQFWAHQMHGLAIYLDESKMPLTHRRAAIALARLRDAAGHLAAASSLEVRNLAFCTQVDCYGRYQTFEKNEFSPGQETILYVEIDNFTSESTAAGFETELQGSYQILDAAGHRIFEHAFPVEKEVCQIRRRDFFIPYRLWIPERIQPGHYTLQLLVEDLKAKKFGQASVDFAVR